MDKSGVIYFDHHSHALLDPRVADVLADTFRRYDANPHSGHAPGEAAREAVEEGRREVAGLLGVTPAEIVFTSGATEANNLAIAGMMPHLAAAGLRRVLVGAGEHPSVLHACEGRGGVEVLRIPLDADGLVRLDRLEELLAGGVGLVSVAAANHEIGTLQPIAEISRRVRAAGALMHCDLAQSAGRFRTDPDVYDLASLSAHKLHGPIGIGALAIRRRLRRSLSPMFRGGGQEAGLRPGTIAPALVAGFGSACRLAGEEMATEAVRIRSLRDGLLKRLQSAGGVTVNGSMDRLPGNINLSFDGVDGEALTMRLRGSVAFSTGSACTSGSLEPSHVLSAIGVYGRRAEGAVRIGLGRGITEQEVAMGADMILEAVSVLRGTARKVA